MIFGLCRLLRLHLSQLACRGFVNLLVPVNAFSELSILGRPEFVKALHALLNEISQSAQFIAFVGAKYAKKPACTGFRHLEVYGLGITC